MLLAVLFRSCCCRIMKVNNYSEYLQLLVPTMFGNKVEKGMLMPIFTLCQRGSNNLLFGCQLLYGPSGSLLVRFSDHPLGKARMRIKMSKQRQSRLQIQLIDRLQHQ